MQLRWLRRKLIDAVRENTHIQGTEIVLGYLENSPDLVSQLERASGSITEFDEVTTCQQRHTAYLLKRWHGEHADGWRRDHWKCYTTNPATPDMRLS